MTPSTHRAEAMSWRVVKPNAPVPPRAAAPVPSPLHFLATPTRPTAPGQPALATDLDGPLGTVFQAAGALLVEVPLASELTGPVQPMGFVALRQA